MTGEAQDYGPFAACITPLDADYYIVTVDGAQDENGQGDAARARVQVDKRFVPLVEFVYYAGGTRRLHPRVGAGG